MAEKWLMGKTITYVSNGSFISKTGYRLILWLSVVLISACTGYHQLLHPLPPVTYDEVILLTREKVAPELIIKKIKDSYTVFRLNSDEVTDLRKQGVDARVVDYMMETYVEQVRRDQRFEDWNYWHFFYGHYYWWPFWDSYHYRVYHPRPIPRP